ncbi:hypothetical protein FRC12_007123 [Ceratobasidium sp. 428]|nr:hypothetical protein FRC12_007123 [Ceratobasidium sp. 428]
MDGNDGERLGGVLKATKKTYKLPGREVFLKRGRNLRLVLLTRLTYAFDESRLAIARPFLPKISSEKNESSNVSLRGTYNSYLSHQGDVDMYAVSPTLLVADMAEALRLGRKWTK